MVYHRMSTPTPRTTTIKKKAFVSISKDLSNDLKTLGLENTTIKMNGRYPEVITLENGDVLVMHVNVINWLSL